MTLRDSENIGILLVSDLAFDFEAGNGGFNHGGNNDSWQWGVPTSGPRAAASGAKVWATNLSGSYLDRSDSFLESPPIDLPASLDTALVFQHFYEVECCCDFAELLISVEGGDFEPLPVTMEGASRFPCNSSGGEYREIRVDLSRFAGNTVRIRFRFRSDGSVTRSGLYIDDFAISGSGGNSMRFLEAESDADGDGLSNADELARGTNSVLSDTDGDGLLDGVETDTGVFVDSGDAGTDPLDADTDDGGMRDGDEVDFGLDPHDPRDDFARTNRFPVVLRDGEDFGWDIDRTGGIRNRNNDAFDGGLALRVGAQSFPPVSTALVAFSEGTVVLGPVAVGELEVTRIVFVSPTSGFARYVEVFHNPAEDPFRGNVVVSSDLVVSSPVIAATSSGDSVLRSDDDWFVVDDNSQRPSLTFVVSQPENDFRSSGLSLQRDDVRWSTVLEVPPGETVALLHFAALSASRAEAIAKGEGLAALSGAATDGISLQRARQVANFNLGSVFFRRGDVAQDGSLNLTDAVVTLQFLFQGGFDIDCLDAADTNDDGELEITDVIGLLGFMFRGTIPPPPPGPFECGADLSPDDLEPCRYDLSICGAPSSR